MTLSSLYPDISNRKIKTNGIELNIAEQGSGPLILLIHGFPESWYSWRHQFAPLSAAGYKVVAPDMRGYGDSDKPFDVSAYNQTEIVDDIRGLVKSLDYESAIVIGHDWGAPSAWNCALWHPEEFSAVGALSVPFIARSESPPLEKMRKLFAGKFFYQLYFQEPGVADAAVEGYSRWFVSRLKLLEKSLEGKDFLCSNRFTLADICVSYAINLAGALDIKQALKPNIKRWSENLFSRPAFIKSKEYKYEPDQ